MEHWRKVLLGLLSVTMLVACGSESGEEADSMTGDGTIIIGKDNHSQPEVFTDIHPADSEDVEDPDQWVPDSQIDLGPDSKPADAVETTAPDLVDLVEPDVTPDTAPEVVPDVEPDVEQDIGPELCNGQLCPDEYPMCSNGVCVCTGSSCTEGTYCQGGDCVPCNNDSHCGSDCISCASEGLYCSDDGSKCVGCDGGHPCPSYKKCVDGECLDCQELNLCGPDCISCGGETPACNGEACVCNETSCPQSYACDGTACVACTDTDPDFCGPDCLICESDTPHCFAGQCTFCNQDIMCGASCVACTGDTPVCDPEGTGCVQCNSDAECGGNEHCANHACVPNCIAQGCATDNSDHGEECNHPKIVGRVDAVDTVVYNGDTDGDGDDDNLCQGFLCLGGESKCWDASYDNFYRIYLMSGETITAAVTPLEEGFDSMMKLYKGTQCDGNDDNDLVDCYNDGDDDEVDHMSYVVDSDGWYTLVVDGRQTGDEYDWGLYSLTITLSCVEANCCCE